jgi:AraC family transcriptional regulator
MGGALTAQVERQGRLVRLSNVTCTLGSCDKPYPELHERNAWTIALVRRGTFRYRGTATNHAHRLRPGWLIIGRPGAEFECSHDRDGGDECTSITISESMLWDVAGSAKRTSKGLLSAPCALAPLPRVVALLQAARVPGAASVDVDEIGYLVTESVVAHLSGGLTSMAWHPGQARRIHDAIDHIEARFREPLALTELASSVGLSPFHFVRIFRRVTGTTPHQYLIGARLRLAVQMLLDTARPITEIAYEVGFQDLSNFIRTFHRVVGRSPRAYRTTVKSTALTSRRKS